MRTLSFLALTLSTLSFAQNDKITLHCTEMEPGYGYPAIVNIVLNDETSEKTASVYPHSYADTEEATEFKVDRVDHNGPEYWYYGKGFELRFDPTVNEGTLFENAVTPQIEFFCEQR